MARRWMLNRAEHLPSSFYRKRLAGVWLREDRLFAGLAVPPSGTSASHLVVLGEAENPGR